MAGRASAAAAALLALLAAVTLWNAARYPPSGGYDAQSHLEYATILWEERRIPGKEIRGYYTPPGFYAVAGAATEVGDALGLGEPRRVALLLNALLAVGAAALFLVLARQLFPGRELVQLAGLAFLALSPVLVKVTAMFHPEPLDLFLTVLALVLAVRVYRRLDVAGALALGVVLGAGQLVRAFSLWTFVAVLAGLVVAALADRRRALVAGAAVVAATAAVAGPWYGYQASRYSNPVFDQPQEPTPLWERRPLAFYVDPGLPEVVTEPWRPHYVNRLWPTAYTELWGDYFGLFAWEAADGEPRGAARRELRVQSAVGLLPSLLAVAGWLGLATLAVRRRSPALVAVSALPAVGFLAWGYFVVAYPTNDGDVLKATYLLTTLPAWALGFGLALERLRARRRIFVLAVALLAVSALAQLPFLLY